MTNTHSEPTLSTALTLDPVDMNHSGAVVADTWDLSDDDLSVGFAEHVENLAAERVARADAALRALSVSTLPDRVLEPFQNTRKEALGLLRKAQGQSLGRSRGPLRRRVQGAGMLGVCFLPGSAAFGRAIVAADPAGWGVAGALLSCFGFVFAIMAWDLADENRRVGPLKPMGLFPEFPVAGAALLAPAPDLPFANPVVRHDALLREYVAFECDPVAVFTLPLLADVRVPDTAAFHDALAEADQARELAGSSPGSDPRFREAVQVAENAWRDAKVTAALAGRRSPQELRDCLDPSPARDARIGRALACARVTVDPKLSRAERDAAHVAMLRAADGVTPVPRGVREMLAITAS